MLITILKYKISNLHNLMVCLNKVLAHPIVHVFSSTFFEFKHETILFISIEKIVQNI